MEHSEQQFKCPFLSYYLFFKITTFFIFGNFSQFFSIFHQSVLSVCIEVIINFQ